MLHMQQWQGCWPERGQAGRQPCPTSGPSMAFHRCCHTSSQQCLTSPPTTAPSAVPGLHVGSSAVALQPVGQAGLALNLCASQCCPLNGSMCWNAVPCMQRAPLLHPQSCSHINSDPVVSHASTLHTPQYLLSSSLAICHHDGP